MYYTLYIDVFFLENLLTDYLLLTVGALLTAFAFAAFFVTNDIAPGGVTGIATVLSSVTGLSVGLLSFLINVPLFAIGWRRVGVRFAVRSFISMILLSLLIDVMPDFDLAGNMMLAAIFGGVTMGAGLGLVVRAGATTGGTDMAAMIVHEHWSMFTVPMVLFAIDGIVVIIAALNFGVQAGLFALVSLYTSTKTMDSVIKGFNTAMQFLIISPNQEEIVRMLEQDKSITDICKRFGLSRDTFAKFRRKYPAVQRALSDKEKRRVQQFRKNRL